MSDTHLDHWSSDDLEADATDTRPDAAPIPTDDHTCRPGEAAPIDAVAGSTRPLPHPDRKPVGIRANCESQIETTTTSVNDAVSATVSGGQGQDSGILADPGHAAQDAKLVRRAIRNGWNVPDSAKPRIVGRLVTIVDQSPDDGDAIKAASVLRAMDAQDQDLAIKEHELARIDGGQATQAIKLYGQAAPVDAV